MKLLFRILLVILILADLAGNYIHFYHTPLDGDLADVIVPSHTCWQVLGDPFGLRVLLNNEFYNGPNRFVVNWSIYRYFREIPVVMQQAGVSPIDSIYHASAIASTLIQATIMFLLAVFITKGWKVLSMEFLLSMLLTGILFQNNAYAHVMGIMVAAVSYSFYYPYAIIAVMLLLLPLYFNGPGRLKWGWLLYIIPLSLLSAFNGPLNGPVIMITTLLAGIFYFLEAYRNTATETVVHSTMRAVKAIPVTNMLVLFILSAVCLYSFYIGLNNSDSSWETISMAARYKRLPKGLYHMLADEWGLSILIGFIIISIFLIRKFLSPETYAGLFRTMGWLLLFICIYTLLLPLGGYRSYRPNIIRSDTFMPVTLCLIWSAVSCVLLLTRHLRSKMLAGYCVLVAAGIFLYVKKDLPVLNRNSCERAGLAELAKAEGEIAVLQTECPVVEWGKVTDYHHSELNAELFRLWNITRKKRLYYQR